MAYMPCFLCCFKHTCLASFSTNKSWCTHPYTTVLPWDSDRTHTHTHTHILGRLDREGRRRGGGHTGTPAKDAATGAAMVAAVEEVKGFLALEAL
jgi:hypothetical protein